MDDIDVGILKAIYVKSHSSLIAPLFLLEMFNISDEEMGDRLEIMDGAGYVRAARGTYVPNLSLLNGIDNVGLTAKGRQILRDKKLV
ncbi:MAG: hypothetical protein ACM3KS_00250 [Phycisphaerales bacterium]